MLRVCANGVPIGIAKLLALPPTQSVRQIRLSTLHPFSHS
jgi:hypothetical protein